jgi:hypothetical protein
MLRKQFADPRATPAAADQSQFDFALGRFGGFSGQAKDRREDGRGNRGRQGMADKCPAVNRSAISLVPARSVDF